MFVPSLNSASASPPHHPLSQREHKRLLLLPQPTWWSLNRYRIREKQGGKRRRQQVMVDLLSCFKPFFASLPFTAKRPQGIKKQRPQPITPRRSTRLKQIQYLAGQTVSEDSSINLPGPLPTSNGDKVCQLSTISWEEEPIQPRSHKTRPPFHTARILVASGSDHKGPVRSLVRGISTKYPMPRTRPLSSTRITKVSYTYCQSIIPADHQQENDVGSLSKRGHPNLVIQVPSSDRVQRIRKPSLASELLSQHDCQHQARLAKR